MGGGEITRPLRGLALRRADDRASIVFTAGSGPNTLRVLVQLGVERVRLRERRARVVELTDHNRVLAAITSNQRSGELK